jgi:hypothetical protein
MWAQHSDQGPVHRLRRTRGRRSAGGRSPGRPGPPADRLHRRPHGDNERARRRFRGVLQAVARRGLTLQPDALVETDYGFREGFEAMQACCSGALPVTAVVCGNDYLAAGALSALDDSRRRGAPAHVGGQLQRQRLRALPAPAADHGARADPRDGRTRRAAPDRATGRRTAGRATAAAGGTGRAGQHRGDACGHEPFDPKDRGERR